MARNVTKVNTAKPEEHPGRKIRNARKRLEARIDGYEQTVKNIKNNSSAFRRPGSLKCR